MHRSASTSLSRVCISSVVMSTAFATRRVLQHVPRSAELEPGSDQKQQEHGQRMLGSGGGSRVRDSLAALLALRLLSAVFSLTVRPLAARSMLVSLKSVRGYQVLHSSQAKAVGGRQGVVSSADGALSLKLDTPVGLGGKGGPGTNPEQLFAAGYSACFRGAMGLAQTKLKLPALPAETSVEGLVDIGKHDNGTLGIRVELRVAVPGWPKSDIDKLIQEAHQICPYSHATRNNVKVTLTAV